MLYSMTGYGKGAATDGDLTVTVEIKTVNHRYADVSVKLPRTLLSFENGMRKQVGNAIGRGKADVYVNYDLSTEAQSVPVLNRQLAAAYYRLFDDMAKEFDLQDTVSIEQIIGQRDVVQVEEADIDNEALGGCLTKATELALQQLISMRLVEGGETLKDFEERLLSAEKMLSQVEARAPQVPIEWQEKLTERLARLQQGVEWDPQRVAQEIAIFTDRCDVSEEVTRFKSHLVQFRALLKEEEPVGRRMDFLVQELNREVNTIGSKSNDAELSGVVVSLKSELEKIREQVQNIE